MASHGSTRASPLGLPVVAETTDWEGVVPAVAVGDKVADAGVNLASRMPFGMTATPSFQVHADGTGG